MPDKQKHEVVQHVESIESILGRHHEPAELQAKITELFEALERGDILKKDEIEIAILCNARHRVSKLLIHDSVQAEGYVETREMLEKIKRMLHPLHALGKMYDYKPPELTAEKIKLGIDWGSLDSDDFFGDWQEGQESTSEANLSSREGDVLMRMERAFRDDGVGKKFRLHLANLAIDPNENEHHHHIADFDFFQQPRDDYDEWDIVHRIVIDVYRGQGIASRTIDVAENFLKEQAEKVKRPQVMTMEVGQADLLVLLLKKDFVPATNEDGENINRLLNKDGILIASSPVDERVSERAQWYMFEEDRYYDADGNVRPEIWDYDNMDSNFMKSSFRIRLKKKIQ